MVILLCAFKNIGTMYEKTYRCPFIIIADKYLLFC